MDSYTKELDINAPVEKVYQAITTKEGLEGWWAKCEQEPNQAQVGGTATFRFDKDFTKMEIEKLVPNKEVVWKCINHQFTLEGAPVDEWVGTRVHFLLQDGGDGTTTLRFTHAGLVPTLACYKTCEEGWDHFLASLKSYLETDSGQPY